MTILARRMAGEKNGTTIFVAPGVEWILLNTGITFCGFVAKPNVSRLWSGRSSKGPGRELQLRSKGIYG